MSEQGHNEPEVKDEDEKVVDASGDLEVESNEDADEIKGGRVLR